jgi:hypothetical protein
MPNTYNPTDSFDTPPTMRGHAVTDSTIDITNDKEGSNDTDYPAAKQAR